VTANLAALPAVGDNGSAITWDSSNPAVVSDTGAVNRPSYGGGDANVTLTATIAKGDASDTVTFDLTVIQQDQTDAPDTIPPTLTAANASGANHNSVTLNFTSDEAGIYYYLVYADADPAPNAVTIKAQGTAAAKGAATATAGVNAANVNGLTASMAYKAYVVVEDAAGNVSAVSEIAFSTMAEPTTTEPATTEPATTEPAATEPVTTEPVTPEPNTPEPNTTESITNEPNANEPAATRPITGPGGGSGISPGNGGSISPENGNSSSIIGIPPNSAEMSAGITWNSPFTDVNRSDWYYDSARFAYQNGLFTGSPL
jgi:hypothetical protein